MYQTDAELTISWLLYEAYNIFSNKGGSVFMLTE